MLARILGWALNKAGKKLEFPGYLVFVLVFQNVWVFELLKALDYPTGLFCCAWC